MYTYTFIIPHHNSPELLTRCLDSIPQREDIQIIVVDDNSDVDLRPNIKRTDVELLYIDAEHTKGAGHARNVGLEKAKGKWLLFADSDDYYTDGFITVLDKYINSDIEILYFNYTYIDSKDNSVFPDNNLQILLNKEVKDEEDITFIKYRNNTPWDKMARSEFVKNNVIRFEEVVNGNDALFSLLVARHSKKIELVKDRLYNYVKTPNSIGTKKQTLSELLCRLEHRIKLNNCIKGIGHSEWKNSVLSYLGSVLKEYGMIVLIKLIGVFFYRIVKGKCNVDEWHAMIAVK